MSEFLKGWVGATIFMWLMNSVCLIYGSHLTENSGVWVNGDRAYKLVRIEK